MRCFYPRYILRLLSWCRKYGLRVNLDLHTIPGSQNGLPIVVNDDSPINLTIQATTILVSWVVLISSMESWVLRMLSGHWKS